MCLLIGPPGVGKTLLSKRLQNYPSKEPISTDNIPSTIPTVGTNLTTLTLGKKDEMTIRELGGTMGPIWKKYYKETSSIIYMIDKANRFQVSASCIQMLMMLSHEDTQTLPVLIIFNKIDMPSTMSPGEVETLYRIQNIIQTSPQKISVAEISAKQGQGLETVAKWILENYKAPPTTATSE